MRPPCALDSGPAHCARYRYRYFLFLLAFLTAGCLPYSCNRTESRAILPADSLSRTIAMSMPVDTLFVLDSLRPEEPGLSYPRSLAYAPDGVLWVSDTKNHTITGFSRSGSVSRDLQFDEIEYPYVAGFRADTVIVFTPVSRQIFKILDSSIVGSISIPGDPSSGINFQYVAAFPDGYYYKTIEEDVAGYISRINNSGSETARWPLPGEYWTYAGALRIWSDSLLSLSGYLPTVHLIRIESEVVRLDSLALQGFDSPMLSRTRLFRMGELQQPPLLSAASVAAGDRLFVLNMRPGWLRVDVYDHAGVLKYILTQPDPEFNTNYFPSDIAARLLDEEEARALPGSGIAYELAVSVVEPEARIDRFRWRE